MQSTHAQAGAAPARRPRAFSGARSSALVAGASAVGIVANYAFLLMAGRILGSDDYGAFAALLGLLAVVLLPAGALQMAVSREVSRRLASGDSRAAEAFSRAVLRRTLIATAPLVAVALALAEPIGRLLHIGSTASVIVAELTLATALVFPVALGVLQARDRFPALAFLYVAPWIARLALLALMGSAGYRLGGAVFATFVAAVAGTVLAVAMTREGADDVRGVAAPDLRPFMRYLVPVAAGLVGIALLTHVDILIVKARFSADDASAYAAASAFARVGFFLPATILAVLFPRTAARQARGEETQDILGRSLIATAAFCALLSLVYAVIGVGLVAGTFGEDFAAGGRVLAPFALAIGLFSLANILVGYHLSRGESRYAWIVGGGVVAQVVALALVPTSLSAVVWTNVGIGVVLLAVHELVIESTAPALRAGWKHFAPATRVRVRARSVALEGFVVLTGATAFVCALYWPVVLHFGSTIIGSPGSDSTGSVASFWTMQHESGYHIVGSTHHTLTGAPLGWNQSNVINLQLVLAYYPTYLASLVIGPIAAYNLVTLAGFVLSGASMYLLVRYLGCARIVAAWAALAFIVFPFHIVHQEHASLLHLECLVLLFIALIAVARRPTLLRFTLVALANLGAWLMSGYFGPMAFITTIAFAAGVLVVEKRARAWVVLAGSTAAAGAVAAVLAIATVASGQNAGLGLQRLPEDLSSLSIHPFDLVVPPVGNIVVGDKLTSFWTRHTHGSLPAESSNYLGLLTIALAVAWIVYVYRRRGLGLRAATAGLAAAFIVGLLFALPSPLLGHAMPSRLLWHFIPAFHVPSRWDFLLMTALVPLAALGLDRIRGKIARRNAVAAAALVGIAIVISFLELTVHPARPRWRPTPVPAEYTALERTVRGGLVAEYPLGYSDLYRIWQRVHGRPLVNGAPEGTPSDQVRLSILDPAAPGTANALSLLGVSAIAIHPGGHADTPIEPREPTGVQGFRLVGRYPDQSSVWTVVARPAPALVTYSAGFAPPRRDGNAPAKAAFVADSATLDLRARMASVVRISFDVSAQSGGNATFRIGDGRRELAVPLAGTAPVSIAVAVPRGLSQLLVKSDAGTALDVTQPRAESTTAQPLLHARLVSPSSGF